MSTPYLDEAEKGDHVVMLRAGRVLRQDSLAALRASFPARLFRIRPVGNVFAAMERIAADPELAGRAYLRGQHIRLLQTGAEDVARRIPHLELVEERPTLEDMYIFYGRQA
jgi:ABC-type multidrug transport system ATPase subunit